MTDLSYGESGSGGSSPLGSPKLPLSIKHEGDTKDQIPKSEEFTCKKKAASSDSSVDEKVKAKSKHEKALGESEKVRKDVKAIQSADKNIKTETKVVASKTELLEEATSEAKKQKAARMAIIKTETELTRTVEEDAADDADEKV